MGGRAVRHQLLLGPDGAWREELWLDAVLAAAEPPPPAVPAPRPTLTGPLPVNSCSADSLTLLPGVGPVLAARIAAARAAGLVFRTPADLRQVKGIGPALSARLAPHLVFAGPVDTAGTVPLPGP